jgi:hypothetical protein
MRDMDLAESEKFHWNYYLLLPLIITAIIISSPCRTTGGQNNNSQFILLADTDYASLEPDELLSFINSLAKQNPLSPINIIEPLPDTVLPPDMASPAFLWEDKAQTTAWLITIEINNTVFLKALFNKCWWIPESDTWNSLKTAAGLNTIEVVIEGLGGWTGREIISRNSVSLRFSEDSVNAKLMFMRKPLPFLEAKKNPEKTSLVLGDIASYKPPEPILTDPPVCANCHTYSLDGRHMAIDMDYGGDKGAFLYTQMMKEVVIENNHIYSWQAITPREPATYNMGLFARISPDGQFIAGTVNETSVFVMMDDLFFSQLFFPATGQIAIFDTRTENFSLLPGASLENKVQTSPSWSPDGTTILFSAVSTNPELIQKVVAKEVLKESSKQKISDLNKKYPVQFDIYALPFNHGKGGRAKPLKGASHNGSSNYFPRYSPDGKWIVFTQSPTGLVLQPDSNLVIIPSEGGDARPLNSNQPIMNSWHSWSPNSKWIVFTCKANSPYTELYLTHIDDQGVSSPGIRLFRFSSNELAAMVPEFVPWHAKIPEKMIFGSLENAKKKSMAIDGR